MSTDTDNDPIENMAGAVPSLPPAALVALARLVARIGLAASRASEGGRKITRAELREITQAATDAVFSAIPSELRARDA